LSGSAYAGVRWWSYMAKQPRTYLQTKLKKPMKKDSLYCVRYYVSLGDLSKYATAELGAYLGKVKIAKEDEASLTYEPKIPQVRSSVYTDMEGWQGVCGAFKAEGYEQYLIIGNFAPNDKTGNQTMQRPRGATGTPLLQGYYYVDNVEVFPIKKASECSCEQLDKGDSEFIFGRKGVMTPSMKPATVADAQVFYFKRFQSSLDPSMEPWVKELAMAMEQDPAIKVKLIGHIDEKEAERIRMKPELAALSKRRSETIKEALVAGGIAAGRITVIGLDAASPIDKANTEMGMSKNRRVEVELQ
jgi:outer membrane protein OmpA-like peptidoglycan-associated protein